MTSLKSRRSVDQVPLPAPRLCSGASPEPSPSTPDRPSPYWYAAQRSITLDARLHISPPSSPYLQGTNAVVTATDAFESLHDYGSPSSSRSTLHRPSPISLPSQARRYFRGMSSVAPPNTPQEQRPEPESGGKSASTEQQAENNVGREHIRAWEDGQASASHSPLGSPADDSFTTASSSGSSSRCSTPSPTSPRTPLHPSSTNLTPVIGCERNDPSRKEAISTEHADNAERGGGTLSIYSYDLGREAPTTDQIPLLFGPLESIAAELGDMTGLSGPGAPAGTQGYEIRHFSWDWRVSRGRDGSGTTQRIGAIASIGKD